MWGVEFRKDTHNSLICGSATFEVRYYGQPSKVYRVRWHPDIGMEIDKRGINGWAVFKRRAEPVDLEAILPKAQDFGHDWTYRDFVIAYTFYGNGFKTGHANGTWAAHEQMRRKQDVEERDKNG